jgi:amino acid transporter
VESAAVPTRKPPDTPSGSAPGSKGLKTGALGYMSNLVIAVASVAPAYSLAATLGFIVAVQGVGLQSPAVLLVSFIPMLFIAAAYRYMNKADPDCGTTFAWVTRGMGPHIGWLGGWAVIVADVIVMANLAQIAGIYTFLLIRPLHAWSTSTLAVTICGVLWIAVMTWICWVGIELSARIQQVLLSIEVLTLAAFALVAFIKVYANNPANSIHPEFSWFNPFAISSPGAMVDGVLLGLFIYWGWDSGVAVNEESENSADGPGKAAVLSTILLLLIYVVVSAAAQAYSGTNALANHSDDVLGFLGGKVFPWPLSLLLVITVLTSASASTQTTILPTARTSLSMARWGAIPRVFGRVHPRYQTPDVSTLVMGALSIIWFIAVVNISNNVLGDSITALGFMIAFYYGLTGFACTIYYRRELFKNPKNFFLVGLAPLVGGLMLLGIFIKAMIFYGHQVNNYSPNALGIGLPDVIGIGGIILGIILMIWCQIRSPAFFRRRPEVADPEVLTGHPASTAIAPETL